MLSNTIALAVGLASLVSASTIPIEARNTCTYKTFTDNFDNYTTVQGAPEASPIRYNGGLFYNAFVAARELVDGTGFILPSMPNGAVAFVGTDLTQAGVVTLNPFGTLSINGTKTRSFALLEFYYGCIEAADNDAATVTPVGCGIEVYGYDVYNNRVGSAAYNFAPQNPVLTYTSRAILPAWFLLLQNVTFAVSTSGTTTATTILLLDNVTHVNCYY